MMNKKTKKHAIIGAVAVIAITLVVLSTGVLSVLFGNDNMLTAKFYDPNGNEIKNWFSFSMIKSSTGTVLAENAASMSFTIKVTNSGQLPLTVSLDTLTPAVFSSVFANTPKTINPGESTTWTSSAVATAQFEGTSPQFYAKVKGAYIYGGQAKTIAKEGSLTYQISADPVANMDVTLLSSAGDSSGMGETPTNSTTTLKTTGTSCTANSECQSGVCSTSSTWGGVTNPDGTNKMVVCTTGVWKSYPDGGTVTCTYQAGCQTYCSPSYAIVTLPYNVQNPSCSCNPDGQNLYYIVNINSCA